MSEAYSDMVLDHFEHPRNVVEMDDATIIGKSDNPSSGASLFLYFRLGDGEVIKAVRFKAHGCTATIAAGSVATELLPGRCLAPRALSTDELAVALDGLPPGRKHAYRLVTDAIESAALSRSVQQPS